MWQMTHIWIPMVQFFNNYTHVLNGLLKHTDILPTRSCNIHMESGVQKMLKKSNTKMSFTVTYSKPQPAFSTVKCAKYQGGGYKANFLCSVTFLIFQYHQDTRQLLKITFIFDRCRRSSAAVAPVKYKCDSNNLRGSFARSKILFTEKLTNGALVTPTPDHTSS